jgi:predicted alpha/beta hydrolase family esterase
MHYIILHGTWCTPDDHRFPWLREQLEVQWHSVLIPALPNAEKPNRQEWSAYVMNTYHLDENMVLIGHSAWATVILSILEQLKQPIAKAILVSWFYQELEKAWRAKLMLQDQYDREKICKNAQEIILINSDDDPRGCTDTQARHVAKHLGAQFVLAKWMGHMGTQTFNDSCTQLQLLLKYV